VDESDPEGHLLRQGAPDVPIAVQDSGRRVALPAAHAYAADRVAIITGRGARDRLELRLRAAHK
jgi:hypothetical protein